MTRKAASHRLEFEAEAIYQYPEQLRPWIADLPNLPGVYIFHGESESLPLYIGKSVNIRTRVMSHLRTPAEARMLYQARRISFIPTAGEMGALLLEAQMIKLQQPLFNKRLRKNRQLCSLLLRHDRPEVVYAKEVDFSHTPNLFGLYAHRRAALATLQKIADEQQLCFGLLGLEPLSKGRPCFRFSLRRCAGACCGKEPTEAHYQRLLAALEAVRLQCWPWPGAIAVVEEGVMQKQIHVINNWLYLGSVSELADAAALCSTPPGFDSDGYKILCRPLLSGKLPVIPLPVPAA
ncbi:excinuclease Cho [Erwinia persicina]|uniref:Excinuclease cho n=1 Tax=Erwinia persicina TaxID=55211 RepID=A0A4U3FMK7_9GAMM|nr:excinuclease Cho [Erwinia persicina]MBC3944310.1 excinuclease Cho [Erwinia persicina]MBD8105336.1 excinuclease Cho [Erwinia persicina]MBD8165933.1 excinuclease Cho [Erwinia persicina]MBD8208482.1 excinuclease Cho [Erwinia persicina]MCQ4104024.1 excinuclease Cho [Erwinia persicina]